MRQQLAGTDSADFAAYAYSQWQRDSDILAWFNAYNITATNYLEWFNTTGVNLSIYKELNGQLLDWCGETIYGVVRPALLIDVQGTALFGLARFGVAVFGVGDSSAFINDNEYKQLIEWYAYRGDGFLFTIPWLKARIKRFIKDSDATVSVVIGAGGDILIQIPNTPLGNTFAKCSMSYKLSFPLSFQNFFVGAL